MQYYSSADTSVEFRGFFRRVYSVALKDFHSEFRTRSALNSLALFVVVSVLIILLALQGDDIDDALLSGMMWLVIFFSGMAGLSRSFVAEEERGTAMTLQLFAAPSVIFWGKLLFNVVLLSLIATAVSLLFLFFLPFFYVRSVEIFFLVLIPGVVSFAATATLMAAIVAKTRVPGTLFTVLSFPPMIPLLLSAIEGTSLAIGGGMLADVLPHVWVLVGYTFVVLGASLLLFHFVWKE